MGNVEAIGGKQARGQVSSSQQMGGAQNPRGRADCPACEAPLNSFAAQVPDPALVATIDRLKAERDAVILAHYYVQPEVQAVADYVGDSFYLAKLRWNCPENHCPCGR